MAVGGCFLAVFGGFLLHLVPGKIIFLVSGVSGIAASLMFALAPSQAGFWNCVFPAMIFATVSIDLVFNCANVFLSTSLPRSQQGLAGGLSNALVHLSVAVQLGLAEVVAAGTSYQGAGRSYKNVFWFAVACGTAALVIFALFVRIGKATSELTAEEKQEADTYDLKPLEADRTYPCFPNDTRSTMSIDIVDYKSVL
jgi:MFS family permease